MSPLDSLPTWRVTTIAALILVPTAVPAAYLWNLKRTTIPYISETISGVIRSPPAAEIHDTLASECRSTKCLDGSVASSEATPRVPASLNSSISKSPYASTTVAYERLVSHPVSIPSCSLSPRSLTTAYLRATMLAFSHTPQALIMRRFAMAADPVAVRSFEADHISALEFAPGDLANGGYRVSHRDGDIGDNDNDGWSYLGHTQAARVELILDPPAQGYKGPMVKGCIVAGWELVNRNDAEKSKECDHRIVFFNETWMWRGQNEKPTMLETGLGRWFHSLLAGWLIKNGLTAIVSAV